MRGISTFRRCTADAACIKEHGWDLVIRYYSRTTRIPEKVLTKEEARALSSAALQIAVVYEDKPVNADYFNRARGINDGEHAYNYALETIVQPPGSAIYFAVDYDASNSEIQGPIADYFRGVFQGFQNIGGQDPIYQIGIYGSGAACDWMRRNMSFVKFYWLAESTGWRGHAAFANWNIKQFVTHTALCGLHPGDWERNETVENCGQFLV